MAKKIIIKKKKKKEAGDTYADMSDEEIPQLRTKQLKVARPKIVSSEDAPDEEKKAESTRFKFYCIRCGQKLEAQSDWAGREVNCTTCDSKIEIPEPP